MNIIVQGLLSVTLVAQGYVGGSSSATEQSIFTGGVGANQKIINQGYGTGSGPSTPTEESIFSCGLGDDQRLITQGYFINGTPPVPPLPPWLADYGDTAETYEQHKEVIEKDERFDEHARRKQFENDKKLQRQLDEEHIILMAAMRLFEDD